MTAASCFLIQIHSISELFIKHQEGKHADFNTDFSLTGEHAAGSHPFCVALAECTGCHWSLVGASTLDLRPTSFSIPKNRFQSQRPGPKHRTHCSKFHLRIWMFLDFSLDLQRFQTLRREISGCIRVTKSFRSHLRGRDGGSYMKL